jgi:glycosyltransferase involved in cell wall biosynthesis
MSNALLEAMAMEVPVIASAIPGNDEVVTDGQNGLLVPYGDAAALAAAIASLVERPDARRTFGEAARRLVVERYSAPAMVRRMEGLYAGLQRGGQAGAAPPV